MEAHEWLPLAREPASDLDEYCGFDRNGETWFCRLTVQIGSVHCNRGESEVRWRWIANRVDDGVATGHADSRRDALLVGMRFVSGDANLAIEGVIELVVLAVCARL
jgi:hypothetical protein